MVVTALVRSYAKVSHVLFATFGANLKVYVTFDLRELVWMHSTLTMQSINVLRYTVLQNIATRELSKSQVRKRGLSFQNSIVVRCRVPFGQLLAFLQQSIFVLFHVLSALLASRPGCNHSLVTGPEVRNATCCRDACTSEH